MFNFSAITLIYSFPPFDYASFLARIFVFFPEHLSEFVHIIVSPCFRLYYSYFNLHSRVDFYFLTKESAEAFFLFAVCTFFLVLGYIRDSDSYPQHTFPNDSRGVFPQSYIKQGFFYSDIRNT